MVILGHFADEMAQLPRDKTIVLCLPQAAAARRATSMGSF